MIQLHFRKHLLKCFCGEKNVVFTHFISLTWLCFLFLLKNKEGKIGILPNRKLSDHAITVWPKLMKFYEIPRNFERAGQRRAISWHYCTIYYFSVQNSPKDIVCERWGFDFFVIFTTEYEKKCRRQKMRLSKNILRSLTLQLFWMLYKCFLFCYDKYVKQRVGYREDFGARNDSYTFYG